MAKNKQKPSFYIGVDGGGTKTKISVLNSEGKVINQAIAGPGNIRTSAKQTWQSFEEALLQCLSWVQIKQSDLHVLFGSAGTEYLASVDEFMTLKPSYVTSYELVSDAYTACVGAHGNDHGVIIIVGTGVIGYQLESNKATQVGGWGFPHSDEGGGAWLGMQAVGQAFKAFDGIIKTSLLTSTILEQFNNNPHNLLNAVVKATPADFGKFAPTVVECAKKGDSCALNLLKASGNYINQIANVLEKKQQDKSKVLPLTLIGGIAEFITPYISEDIARRLTPRLSDTVGGAVWLLRKKFSLSG